MWLRTAPIVGDEPLEWVQSRPNHASYPHRCSVVTSSIRAQVSHQSHHRVGVEVTINGSVGKYWKGTLLIHLQFALAFVHGCVRAQHTAINVETKAGRRFKQCRLHAIYLVPGANQGVQGAERCKGHGGIKLQTWWCKAFMAEIHSSSGVCKAHAFFPSHRKGRSFQPAQPCLYKLCRIMLRDRKRHLSNLFFSPALHEVTKKRLTGQIAKSSPGLQHEFLNLYALLSPDCVSEGVQTEQCPKQAICCCIAKAPIVRIGQCHLCKDISHQVLRENHISCLVAIFCLVLVLPFCEPFPCPLGALRPMSCSKAAAKEL